MVCRSIQDFRLNPMIDMPDMIRNDALRTLRALVKRFNIASLEDPISDAQNAEFATLIRRYAPLFPQRSDQEPAVEVQPKFAEGKQHPYPMPRPEERPLMPTPYNEFLCFDETNTDEDQETWGFDHAMFGAAARRLPSSML